MATNKNFEIKNGLSVAGTERISSAGVITGSLASGVTATTQSAADSSTKIATTAYTDAAITALIGGAPSALNDLNELAAAIADDANYSTTLTTALATKLPLAGGTMTGTTAHGDGVASTFGNSADLTISHAGGSTYLTNTTGSLILRSDSFRVLNTANSEQILHGTANGAVVAYYDNAVKLATAATGIDVTGNVKISGASSYSAANLAEANNENMALHISPVRASVATGISIGDFGSVSGIQAYNNSTNAALSFVLNPFGGNVGIGTNNPTMGKLQVTGPKYVITNSGKALGGIHVNPDSGATLGQFGGAISLSAGGNGSSAIAAVNDGGSDNDSTGLAFFVHGSGTGADDATEVVRIDQLGNVGIGTTGPTAKLEIGPEGSLGANITNKNVLMNVLGGYGTTGTPSSGQYKVIGFTGTTKDVTDITGQTGGEVQKNFYVGMIGLDYFNGNRFSVWQGGSERLTIQGYGAAAGNVGIGITSPNSKLMVIDTTDARKQIEFGNHVTYRGSIGHDAGSGRNEYRTEAGGGRHAFFKGATSTTPEMEILQDGQVLMPYQSSAMAHKNGNYFETSGVNDVTGWTIKHNIGSDLSTSGSYTCPQAGRYLCTFSAMSGQTTGDVQFRICRGATILLGSNSMAQGGGPWRQTTVTGVVDAALGDVLKPVAYSSATNGAIQQVYNSSYSTLSFHFLG